jgi:hypothetical protein
VQDQKEKLIRLQFEGAEVEGASLPPQFSWEVEVSSLKEKEEVFLLHFSGVEISSLKEEGEEVVFFALRVLLTFSVAGVQEFSSLEEVGVSR